MQNNNLIQHLHKSNLTYAMITERTAKGPLQSYWCITREQYKRIKRERIVVIRNIGKANFKLLNQKAL